MILFLFAGLVPVLDALARRQVYQLLVQEGTHLAASIQASTSLGFQGVRAAHVQLVERMRITAAWLDSSLTGDPREDLSLLQELVERDGWDLVAVFHGDLRPHVWAGNLPGGPRWPRGGPRPPLCCPEAMTPMAPLVGRFYAGTRRDQVLDRWGWHHRPDRGPPRPVVYLRRRNRGGVILVRAPLDLLKRSLDVQPFQTLLENLTLTQKVREIAVVVDNTIVFCSREDKVGERWVPPRPEARVLVISRPFVLDEDTTGTLYLLLSTDDASQILSTTRRSLLLLAVGGCIVGAVGVWGVFAGEGAQRRREAAMRERLHEQERLADLGRMAALVAHEVRNPLNALSMLTQRAGALVQQGRSAELGETLGLVREEIHRLDRMVQSFVDLARQPPQSLRPLDLQDIVSSVVHLYAPEAEAASVKLVVRGEPCLVRGDPDRIHQALSNLVRNALEASGQGGEVRVEVRPEEHEAVVSVEDSGPGFPPELLQGGLQPFFSTKARGMGLGLALSHRVASDHGGTLRLQNGPRGARAELRIPRDT